MSKKIIVANWKMNLNLAQSQRLAQAYRRLFKKSGHTIVVCPSEFALASVKKIIQGSVCQLGAQNLFWQANGSEVGEVSAQSLAELGCRYVLLGHSARRQLGETCRLVNLKLKAALANKKLIPIVCVGESRAKRRAGQSLAFVQGQVRRALADIKTKQPIIIAYEPLWAIGTGQAIQPQQAQIMHQYIKQTISKLLGRTANIQVLYGGSVNPRNSASFLSLKDIDGLLVGQESLSAQKFYKIANIKVKMTKSLVKPRAV